MSKAPPSKVKTQAAASPVDKAVDKSRTIYRVARREVPFAQIANGMLRDKTLSIEARGTLALIMSYPPDWEVRCQWLTEATGCGRDKTRGIINELIGRGYCKREQTRNADGSMGLLIYTFTDSPFGVASLPQPEKPSPVPGADLPATEKPAPVDQAPEEYREGKNTERNEYEVTGSARKVAPTPAPPDEQKILDGFAGVPVGQVVLLEDGSLCLFAELRDMWLKQFGDDAEALALALTEARAAVPNLPRNAEHLQITVNSQLARISRWSRESLQRKRPSGSVPGGGGFRDAKQERHVSAADAIKARKAQLGI